MARAHVIAWRKDLERIGLSAASNWRKLSRLSSLFDTSERNAVAGNPVDRVKMPMANAMKATLRRWVAPR
jgi:integrase/recombinase XerD